MDKYLKTGIKEIINEYPEIGTILEEYNIGCVPCNVGTCRLEDIVEVHNISQEEENELLTKMAGVIYPEREVKIPEIKRKVKHENSDIKYSPPLMKLVMEHVLIKRLLALIPEIVKNLDLESDDTINIIKDIVDFIRNYADKYHHAKEEDILFKYFDKNLEIINAMLIDHTNGREHVKEILNGLDSGNKDKVVEHINAYGELLKEHIKKEDEILYLWMDRNMSTSEVGKLFSEFNEVDIKFGNTEERYNAFIDNLEKKFNNVLEMTHIK